MRQGGIGMLLVVAGCGGGLGSPSGEFATTPGASVLTPTVRRVTLTSKGGGFGAEGVPGAVCGLSVFSYTFSLDTKRLAFDGCRLTGDGSLPESYVLAMDDLALTDPQFETVTAAAHAVAVSANRQCGADANNRELRVESATSSLTYGDDFYGCLTTYDAFVTFDSLNNLESVLYGILH